MLTVDLCDLTVQLKMSISLPLSYSPKNIFGAAISFFIFQNAGSFHRTQEADTGHRKWSSVSGIGKLTTSDLAQ